MPIHHGAIFNNRFQIISNEPLGAGGMGQVWLAYDRTLDKKLVLKFVNVGFGLDSQAEADLKREVKLAQELSHPNIVRINDIHNEGKLFFISMAYIEGLDLVKWLYQRGSNFTPLELLQIIKPICDAVHYAHSRKILHLDIKPSNMMVDRHGCVYLLDFGISRAAQESLTRITRVSGFSPGYAAPEQVQGNEADRRTDVYGLAASCYHLLSGRPPFYKGDISYQSINIAPQPIEGLTTAINGVIMKGLAKEKEERFLTAAAFYDTLEIAVNQKPTDAEVPNFIGMILTNAESKAREQGLKIVVTSEKYNDQVAAGAIIDQTPRVGIRVKYGSVVEVVVSKGKKQVSITVPDWVGKPLKRVEGEATTQGIKIVVKTEESSNQIAASFVIRQNPMPGSKIPPSESVDLVLSKGKEPAPVFTPNPPKPTPRFQESVPSPTPPSKRRNVWLPVTLILGIIALLTTGYFLITSGLGESGRPPIPPPPVPPEVEKTVAVPRVIGMDVAKAEETFKGAGFQVNIQGRPLGGEATKVTDQSPASGQINSTKGEWVINCTKQARVEKVEDGFKTVIESSGPFGNVTHREKKYKDVSHEAEYKAVWAERKLK